MFHLLLRKLVTFQDESQMNEWIHYFSYTTYVSAYLSEKSKSPLQMEIIFFISVHTLLGDYLCFSWRKLKGTSLKAERKRKGGTCTLKFIAGTFQSIYSCFPLELSGKLLILLSLIFVSFFPPGSCCKLHIK